MDKIIELTNIEKPVECCTLDILTGKTAFYRGNKKIPGFTGLYFKDNNNFFAIYPTKNGPTIFYEGKEYEINKDLSIVLLKKDKNRIFQINDYNIEVNYMESPFIGFDAWSDEIDVDLFFMIEQSYKEQSFYDKYTLRD